MTLPEFLKYEMEKRSKNRAQFAKDLDIHQTQLERLLNLAPGKVPRASTIKHLADKLGYSENELIALCYGNSEPLAEEAPAHHGLNYGTCYDLIEESKKIQKGKNPSQQVLDPLTIAEILCAQDRERYKDIDPLFAGEPSQWMDIFANYPDSATIFYFVREIDGLPAIEIAGDFSIAMFHADEFRFNDEDGTIAEDEIKVGSIPSLNTITGACDLVILNMSLANQYNTRNNNIVLVKAFEEWMHRLPDDVKVRRFYVNAYPRDYGFFEDLGFTRRKPDTKPQGNRPVCYMLTNTCNINKNFRFPGREVRK